MTGRVIVYEGGEGSGKSTQARILAERLGAELTREPGATPLGLEVRRFLLDPETDAVSPRAEALMMAADRAQHVETMIRPTLASGTDVVCDRYLYSSVAYQGHGRGLDAEEIRRLSMWATQELLPDVVVLIEVPAEVSNRRLGTELDRFEAADDGFHERVRAGIRAQAEADPRRFVVVDGVGTLDEVAQQVFDAVFERIGER